MSGRALSSRASRPVLAVVAGAILAGIGLRVWLLLSDLGAVDADEAVWGVMARHVLDGELTTFFWGQGYGGTQETLLTAGVFALSGPSIEALRVVPLLLFALAAVLTWRVGRRTVGEPYALLGAALFWAWPPYLLWKSTRAHGFYGLALVLGLVVLLLALRLHERPSRIDLALLGAALGLGWWATPQIAILGVPAVVWLFWQRSSLLRDAWVAVAAAVVASLPWLVANLRHDWYSFELVAEDAGEGSRLHNLAVATLPTALGLRLPFSLEWVPGAAVGWLLYAVLLGALGWTLVRHRRCLQLFLLTAIAFPILYALSPYASLNAEPRYLVLVAPLLALVLARSPGSPLRAAAVVTALVVLATVGTGLLERRETTPFYAEGVRVPADIGPLLETLAQERVGHAFADYWLTWRIAFESDERLVAVTTGSRRFAIRGRRVIPVAPELGRYPPYFREVIGSRDAAYIFLVDGNREAVLRPLLSRAGYRRRVVAEFAFWVPASRTLAATSRTSSTEATTSAKSRATTSQTTGSSSTTSP